jgi:hypothetical protein
MATMIKTAEPHIKLAAPKPAPSIRTGGESIPLDYPSLYQIQAGDWRISYAVENNRLAILVLEVLNPDGVSSKDTIQADLKRKMKIKLLDWPEGAGDAQVPPEDLSKKLKIKWLDMAQDGEIAQAENAHSPSRIKLKGSSESKSAGKRKITLIDAVAEPVAEEASEQPVSEGEVLEDQERKVTPVDEPSV